MRRILTVILMMLILTAGHAQKMEKWVDKTGEEFDTASEIAYSPSTDSWLGFVIIADDETVWFRMAEYETWNEASSNSWMNLEMKMLDDPDGFFSDMSRVKRTKNFMQKILPADAYVVVVNY